MSFRRKLNKAVLTAVLLAVSVPAAAKTARRPNSSSNPPLEAPYTRPASSSNSSGSSTPIERPTEIDEDTGDYYYVPKDEDSATQYHLDKVPPIKSAVFMRFGSISAFDIAPGGTTATYKDVYGDKSSFIFYAEYEGKLADFGGQWSYKIGTGVMIAAGKGHFAGTANASKVPKEKYSLYAFPNTFMVNYKFRFSDTQWITPYVEAGPGYFAYMEYRSDADLIKINGINPLGGASSIGGAGFLAGAAGILISISQFDKNQTPYLYEEYGMKHMWLDLQFRRNVGIDSRKDFSSNMITGGFGFAF